MLTLLIDKLTGQPLTVRPPNLAADAAARVRAQAPVAPVEVSTTVRALRQRLTRTEAPEGPWVTDRVRAAAEALNTVRSDIADLHRQVAERRAACVTATERHDELRANVASGDVTVEALDAANRQVREARAAVDDVEQLERRSAERLRAAEAVYTRSVDAARQAWLLERKAYHAPALAEARGLLEQLQAVLQPIEADALVMAPMGVHTYAPVMAVLSAERTMRLIAAVDAVNGAAPATAPAAPQPPRDRRRVKPASLMGERGI